jgi:hypothetical protein
MNVMHMRQLEELNRGEEVVTYHMLQAPRTAPVVGEIRYLMPLVPAPWEPLSSMMALYPVQIAWTGKEWALT